MPRPRKIPLRMCVGCKARKDKRELIRIVRTPEHEVLIDPTGKKAGRGAYICPKLECLKKAAKSRALEKALGVQISPEILAELEASLQDES
ncbi:MAG: YlxR family protein [Thermanaeromonas sp.]|uniref:RNase P modulator RnpM n=1 Tax=Thermanaeromonas sp. TaxID=2003697 RepID=UPI00243CF34B|nr:YlxR family protein [Thermanaeromonas sp.]